MSREAVIKKTALDLNLSESMVYEIMSNAFEQLTKASRTHAELEVSGFGTFNVSPNKIQKRLPGLYICLEKAEKEYNLEPTEENFRKKVMIKEDIENLTGKYEKIKGVPPCSTERSSTHRPDSRRIQEPDKAGEQSTV